MDAQLSSRSSVVRVFGVQRGRQWEAATSKAAWFDRRAHDGESAAQDFSMRRCSLSFFFDESEPNASQWHVIV